MKNQHVVENQDFNILFQAEKCACCEQAKTCPRNINTLLKAPATLDWRREKQHAPIILQSATTTPFICP